MSSTPKFYDLVQESSTTTGTGTYTLAGAIMGYQTFAVLGDGNSCYYAAQGVDANGVPNGGYEVGIGTYTVSGTTLSRDTILASSNANAAVSWAAGTKRISLVDPAENIFLPPRSCLAYNSAPQNVTLGATTVLLFDSEQWDNDTMHDTGSQTSRIAFTTAGKYHVSGYIELATSISVVAGAEFYTDVRLNGTTILTIGSQIAVVVDVSGLTLAFDYNFSAADYIELRTFVGGSGGVDVTARFGATQLVGV